MKRGGSPAAINGTETADGRTYLKTHVGSGSSNFVGFRLKDAEGNLYAIPEAGDTLIFSMDINPSASFTPNTETQGFLLRQGDGTAFPGTGEQYKQLAPTTAIPANQWTTVTGSFAFTDAWKVSRGKPNPQLCLGIRTNAEMDIKIDNVSYKVLRATDKVESGWADADYSIPASYALSNIPGTASGNNFSFAMNAVATYFSDKTASNNAYTATITVDPATPVAKNGNWKITADLVMNGLVDSSGKTSIWVRCLDNTTNATQGYTVGYIQKTVDVADGTVHLEFDSSELIAGGGTSSSSTIARFGISFDSSQICNYTDLAANTGSYAYNNVQLVSTDAKLSTGAVKGDDNQSIELTITNNNAEKYKLTGALYAAEYVTGEDNIPEMVQFATTAVNNELDADSAAVITLDLEQAFSANSLVKVFLWEADGTLTPINDWSL